MSGLLRPVHERAVRAVTALEEGRLHDAETNIAAIPESSVVDLFWKLYLRGCLALEHGDCSAAEPVLLQATAWAMILAYEPTEMAREQPSPIPHWVARAACLPVDSMASTTDTGSPPIGGPVASASHTPSEYSNVLEATSVRLAAMALEKLGTSFRRREDSENAFRVHRVAYRLRTDCGSPDELWESATSLGLDMDVARNIDEAAKWHRAAVEHAARNGETGLEKQALAWQHLSLSNTHRGEHDGAVSAARSARECWRRHDLGALSAAQADLALAHALLKKGEFLFISDPNRAAAALDEAIGLLAEASEALSAFGPEGAGDAQTCTEQKDFAERLRASLES